MKSETTLKIRQFAQQLGFSSCGIAKAVPLTDDARRLESWLNKGMHGTMQYMENHFDMRIDPTRLVPGAKSVITLLLNYYPEEKHNNLLRISKYAYGEDYHYVIKNKLKELLFLISTNIGEVNGRGFVDSAPVLERAWAHRSGLGWIGKNGNMVTKDGSFFFIATLITDLELEYDEPFAKDFCGTCTKCIDACPTEAILPGKVVNANKCISYLTIELKDALIPTDMHGKFQDWMFGCDVCQDVCPWNRFSTATKEPSFKPITEILDLTTSEWEQMSEDAFKRLFKRSALKRPKLEGLKRNVKFLRTATSL